MGCGTSKVREEGTISKSNLVAANKGPFSSQYTVLANLGRGKFEDQLL